MSNVEWVAQVSLLRPGFLLKEVQTGTPTFDCSSDINGTAESHL